MSNDIENVEEMAHEYLGGPSGDGRTVLDWRDALRGSGRRIVARALSRKLAERFIAGTSLDEDVVDDLWRACKADEAFSHARRVLLRRLFKKGAIQRIENYPKRPDTELLKEQTALVTSKDPDLPASKRHNWALEILEADLGTSSAETLGIAGGIWKRRWEWDGKVSNLEESLRYYLAPVERGRRPDTPDKEHDREGRGVTAEDGYPAINAAFVCDLLALQTLDEGIREVYRARAQSLRQRICESVRGENYWILVTLAEACFGLGEVRKAVGLLATAKDRQPDPWERETTAKQLARLGSVRGISLDSTKEVVSALFDDDEVGVACVESVLVGKVGLALSGGGFRASLYHLGVLARLAEWDLLRHVQVVSAVSGGSMVGAAYYLRLRKLLAAHPQPGTDDYKSLVEDLIEDFRKVTESNLRSSLLTDLGTCRAILGGDDKAYADGMASALFEKLYSRMEGADPQMADLTVAPSGAPPDFHPRYHNMGRRAKVPALLLNATTLNTGHCWQFTANSMGEPPSASRADDETMPRLRRAYYKNQQGQTVRPVTLSQAVAASACVPGLFAPLRFEELYEGYDVRLVDGGVYDNQGALGLIQEDCDVLIVSDACGQLGLQQDPAGGHLPPLLRSVSVFQERMRQTGVEGLSQARDSGRLKGLAYIHLKQDLWAEPVDWKHCEDPFQPVDHPPTSLSRTPATTYDVWKPYQSCLAEIRTDLDVFSEIESASLMASGYLALHPKLQQLSKDVAALAKPSSTSGSSASGSSKTPWFFERIIPALQTHDDLLEKHLKAGSVQFLRIMELDTTMRNGLFVVGGITVALLGAVFALTWKSTFSFSVGWVVVTVGGIGLSMAARRFLGKWSWTAALTNPVGALRSRVGRWVGALFTWGVARWLVPRVTARYLDQGKLEQLDQA